MRTAPPPTLAPAVLDKHVAPFLYWRGLHLGVTACRAASRYGRRVRGWDKGLLIPFDELLSPVDELLDVVRLDATAPRGFRFCSISLADFWQGLQHSGAPEPEMAEVYEAQLSPGIDRIRHTVQAAIADAPRDYLAPLRFELPETHLHIANEPLAPPIETLISALAGQPSCGSNPWMVEMVADHRLAGSAENGSTSAWREAPGQDDMGLHMHCWHNVRLISPRHSLGDYLEIQFTLPSQEISYYSKHFAARNLFAHIRATRLTVGGRFVLLIDEIQSDWCNDWRRQQKHGKPEHSEPSGAWRGLDGMAIPPCPLGKDWLRVALGELLGILRSRSYDYIAWMPAALVRMAQPNLPPGVAREIYDRQLPKVLRQLLGNHPRSVPFDAIVAPVNIERNSKERTWELRDHLGIPVKDGLKTIGEARRALQAHGYLARFQLPALSITAAQRDLFSDRLAAF